MRNKSIVSTNCRGYLRWAVSEKLTVMVKAQSGRASDKHKPKQEILSTPRRFQALLNEQLCSTELNWRVWHLRERTQVLVGFGLCSDRLPPSQLGIGLVF